MSDTYSIPDKKENNGLCGLQNIGNTCYMNTIIQCISNCQLFKEYFNDKKFVDPLITNIKEKEKGEIDMKCIYNKFNNTLTYQLFRIIKVMGKANDCTLSINTFKNLFGNKINSFYGYGQHDTDEILVFLFMTIENEINVKGDYYIENVCPDVKKLMDIRDTYIKYIKENNLIEDQKEKIFAEYNQYKSDNKIAVRNIEAYKSWKTYNTNNRNIIMDLFAGYFHEETICPECNNIIDKFDSFEFLNLTLGSDSNLVCKR